MFRRTCVRSHITRILTCTCSRDVTSGSASFVAVVQAADFPDSDHLTLGDTLHTSGRGRVFRQRQMGSRSVIVRTIAGQDAAQMLLAQYHDVVQAVASD
jgi:hypothetical protein